MRWKNIILARDVIGLEPHQNLFYFLRMLLNSHNNVP